MNIVRTILLMIFAFGVAIIAKYVGFHEWVAQNAWIGLPMMAGGAVGIVLFFVGDE